MKRSICLLISMTLMTVTFVTAGRHGEKIHFHDSSEVGEFDIDERPGRSHGNRNHRGRAIGHHKYDHIREFEQGIPDIYPIKGPPQAPLVLPSDPNRGIDLEYPQTTSNLPTVTTTSVKNETTNKQPAEQPRYYHYAGNPYLSKIISNPSNFPAVTNQLPNTDKPSTTTPSYVNPRRLDLMYGSNLLEEAEGKTEITFTDRGLFDTAPHCQSGQILVNNRCRLAV